MFVYFYLLWISVFNVNENEYVRCYACTHEWCVVEIQSDCDMIEKWV
jgi:hypothetical protein